MAYDLAVFCGHGRSTDGSWDPGAVYNGWTEAGRALVITQSCVTHLRNSGLKVLTDAFDGNNINMIKQVEKANKYKLKVYFVNHLDWSEAPEGTYPLYTSDEGKKIAECVNDAVTEAIGISTRGEAKSTKLYELNKTKAPAVIFECGGIKADLKYFDTAKECEAYGKAQAQGLCKYLGVKFKDKPVVKYKTSKYAKEIKKYLKATGWYEGTIDNKVTPAYTEAVTRIQTKYFKRKSDRDGLDGPNTLILAKCIYNMRGIKYFDLEELRCNCGKCTGYPAAIDRQLMLNMDDLRKEYGEIIVTSCIRCKYKNSSLSGSSPTSRHMKAKAMDFYNKKLTSTKAKRTSTVKMWYTRKKAHYAYANTPGMGNAVHVDVK